MDKLDFIGSPEPTPEAVSTPVEAIAEPAASAPAPDPTPEPAPAEPQGQPRDEMGRFTAPQDQPAAQPPPASPKPPPGYVPVSAVQAERAQRQALEDQLRALQELQEGYEEPVFDPQVFAQQQMAAIQQAQMQMRLNTSEMLARRAHGDQTVEAAIQWVQQRYETNPAYQAEVLNAPDPYEYAIQAHQRHQRDQLLADVSTDELAAFKAWKAQQAQALQQPTLAAPTQGAPPSPPTPSLASAPSAAGAAHVATGPGTAFGGLFKGP